MSHDGWISLPIPGSDDEHTLADLGDYTSNIAPMWAYALSLVCESPMRLSDTEGWTCEKAAPILAKAVAVMEAEPDRMRQWEPANGWGDYEGALKYLRTVAESAGRFAPLPGACLRWWV